MPNDKRLHRGGTAHYKQIIAEAAQVPGADPIAVRTVNGALTFGVPAYSGRFTKDAPLANDDPGVNLGVDFDAQDAAIKARVEACDWLRRFSTAAFFIDFTDGGASASATVEAWRVLDNGIVVSDGSFVDVGHRALIRDGLVQGMRTYYRLTNITLDGATAITVHIAGEGVGFTP